MTLSPQQSLLLGDVYLQQATHILCLATHSKLGLTTFTQTLRARHQMQNSRRLIAITDGGIIGTPIVDYLPQGALDGPPPSDVILLVHEQDPPPLLERYGTQLHKALLGIRCYFHISGTGLDTDISN